VDKKIVNVVTGKVHSIVSFSKVISYQYIYIPGYFLNRRIIEVQRNI